MSKLTIQLENSVVEKDSENFWRSELLKHIQDSSITSPFGGDGLLTAQNPATKKDLRALLEFKYDEMLKSKLTQCNILIQCLYYIKKYELAGQKLPTTIFVGDINECFAIHTNAVVKYLGYDIDWKIAPSEAHKKNIQMVQAMVEDIDILPFIYDVNSDFKIHEVIAKLWDLTENVVRKIRITKENMVNIYDYFEANVLKDCKLTTNQKANLFIQIVINPDENYLHPKKSYVVTKSYGEIMVNRNQFNSFFSHFEGDIYSPKEKEGLTALVDRLIEEETRRKKGEFFTPTAFVNLAHQYLSKTFGEDWKERFVVWDCAWGTGNLTRDYKFKELYASTIEQSDIDTANQMGYNPEAKIFYYDFLNDDYSLLPQGLRDAIEGGKEILFLINPPYATANNMGTEEGDHKAGVADTKIGLEMKNEKWGPSTRNIYAQFLYRITKFQKINGNIKIGVFCKPNYLTASDYQIFREKFFNYFGYEKGFLFQASHFSDVSTQWGIDFVTFSSITNNIKSEFNHDLIDVTEQFTIGKINEKTLYNLDDKIEGTKWVRNSNKKKKMIDTIQVSSALKPGCSNINRITETGFSYLLVKSNNVVSNGTNVGFFSTSTSNRGGISIDKDNFEKACSLFMSRKSIKGNWINDKDEYLAPNEQHPLYDQFSLDSIVYSLFNNSSQQSSLRQVDYKDKKWDIKNEFFWLSKEAMKNLANDNSYDALYQDARTSDERFVYNKLFVDGIYDKLSPDAKEVLDMATDLLKRSMSIRKLMSESHPEYHLDSWDCGYAQLKLVWKEYFKTDFEKFRSTYKKLEDRMRPLVYELGFLR